MMKRGCERGIFMVFNNLLLGAVCFFAMLTLDYMIKNSDILEKRMKKYFRLTILFIMLVVCAEAGTTVAETLPANYRIFHVLCNVVGFSLSPVVPLLLACAFCNRYTSFWNWSALPAFINIVFTVISPLSGSIFTVSAQNDYARGDWYFVYVFSYLAEALFLFYESYISLRRYQNKNRNTLLALIAFLAVGTSLQLVFPQVHTTWLCVTLALPIYYSYFCELSEKHDVLTELFNRRAYECELQELEKKPEACIILLDVDDFKKINDTKGHQNGDLCLHALGEEIKEAFQTVGRCYRIGGDEFCVISEYRLSEWELNNVIKDFNQKLGVSVRHNLPLPTVSVGYSFYKKEQGAVSAAVQAADRKLYENKRAKRQLKEQKVNS